MLTRRRRPPLFTRLVRIRRQGKEADARRDGGRTYTMERI
jgi:hypothetical protein